MDYLKNMIHSLFHILVAVLIWSLSSRNCFLKVIIIDLFIK